MNEQPEKMYAFKGLTPEDVDVVRQMYADAFLKGQEVAVLRQRDCDHSECIEREERARADSERQYETFTAKDGEVSIRATEPTTEAAQAFLANLLGRYGQSVLDPISDRLTRDALAAIEAEARADADLLTEDEHIALRIQAVHDALREAAAVVRTRWPDAQVRADDYGNLYRAVLAILDPETGDKSDF